MDEYSPRKLAQALVEKHDRLISEYSDQVEKIRQVTMLREKRDQLLHWVQENGSKDKYQAELKETEAELGKLTKSFEDLGQSHYKKLEQQIEQQKGAKQYWLDKIDELKT